MRSIKFTLLYGFFLWLIPFLVALAIFPLKESQSPFFETIMTITLVICVVFFSVIYFRKVDHGVLGEGIKLGLIWFMMSLIIDLSLFMWGPMKMSFTAYIKDIGLTYLIFPIITCGIGVLLYSVQGIDR